jgi:hypothetical protein
MTPRLTHHARQRCAEMGVSTKRVKRIVQDPDTVRSCRYGNLLAVSDAEPDLAVVYEDVDGQAVVITVLYRTSEVYVRPSKAS